MCQAPVIRPFVRRFLFFRHGKLDRGVLRFTDLLCRAVQQFIDFLIRDLREIEVELTDTIEGFRYRQANQIVDFGSEAVAAGARCYWDSNHDVRRLHLTQGTDWRRAFLSRLQCRHPPGLR